MTICVLAPLLGLLCWYDWRKRKLPNLLTLVLAAVALAWRFCQHGGRGVTDGLLGGLVCGLFLLIPFLMRGAGGGDVKMLFGAGIATGLRYCFAELLFVSLTGLFLGLVMVLCKSVTTARLKHCLRIVFDWKYDRKAGAEELPAREDERGRIPFGVAIALGTVITLLYAYRMEQPL
ncbi:MAG: prepilin peptidase [Victivallales bacterium]|nr:prepilin peptidase [Victivallales bacterium]